MISQPAARLGRLGLIALSLMVMSACSTQQTVTDTRVSGERRPSESRQTATLGERAAAVALQLVGTPYRYGGSTPAGFDCSGLVHYSYVAAGRSIPRTTTALWHSVAPVEPAQMRTGDVLFFNIEGKMSHVGLYLGHGKFIHAPSTGRSVAVERLDNDFYRRALIRAGRPK